MILNSGKRFLQIVADLWCWLSSQRDCSRGGTRIPVQGEEARIDEHFRRRSCDVWLMYYSPFFLVVLHVFRDIRHSWVSFLFRTALISGVVVTPAQSQVQCATKGARLVNRPSWSRPCRCTRLMSMGKEIIPPILPVGRTTPRQTTAFKARSFLALRNPAAQRTCFRAAAMRFIIPSPAPSRVAPLVAVRRSLCGRII